jgi:midasin
MAALMRKQMLRIINCNQHTETSDFLGGYRPNRGRERAMKMLRESVGTFNNYARSADVPELQWPVVVTIENLTHLLAEAQAKASNLQGTAELETLIRVMEDSLAKYRAPFEWVDGPLVLAMRHGDILLIDELNLAEDAVLERLNR